MIKNSKYVSIFFQLDFLYEGKENENHNLFLDRYTITQTFQN